MRNWNEMRPTYLGRLLKIAEVLNEDAVNMLEIEKIYKQLTTTIVL
jgi:hypothetical protein